MKYSQSLRLAFIYIILGQLTLYANSTRIYAVVHGVEGDNFWTPIRNGMLEAAKNHNVQLNYLNPKTSQIEIPELIDQAISNHPDGIIISLPRKNLLADKIKTLQDKNIPIVSIDSGDAASDALNLLTHIGQNEHTAGIKAGEYAKAEGVSTGLFITHEIDNIASEERYAGYKSQIKNTDILSITGQTPENAKNIITAYLNKHPDIDGIICFGGTSADPTLMALKELNLEGTINLGSFDHNQTLIKALKNEEIMYLIDQQPFLQGYLAVTILDLYHRYHLKPSGHINSGPKIITSSDTAMIEKLISQPQ